MEPERIAETMRAVVAYQLISQAAETNELLLLPAGAARLLQRIITEPDYRAIVMDAWAEVFEHGNGEMFDALKEMLGDTAIWDDLTNRSQTRQPASPMGDTPRISKS
jgi:hypothetical protein